MHDTQSWSLIRERRKSQALGRRHVVDLILLAFAFYTAFALKKRVFAIDEQYVRLFLIYVGAWAVVHLVYDKFTRLDRERRHGYKLAPFVTTCLYMAGLISLYLYLADLFDLSRFVIYGSLSLYLLLEMLVLSGGYLPFFHEGINRRKRLLSFAFFTIELSALSGLYAVVYWSQYGLSGEEPPSAVPFFYINFIWILSGLMIHRFRLAREENYLRTVYPHLKNFAVVICCSAAIMYIFKLTGSSPQRYLLPMLVVASLEMVFVSIYYISGKWDEKEGVIFQVPEMEEAAKVDALLELEKTATNGRVRFEKDAPRSTQLTDKLKSHYLKRFPDIFAFVQRTVDLETVDIVKAEVIDSGNPYNVEVMPDDTMEFFLNLHRLNTQPHLNRYLIEVNRKLVTGGVFIGNFSPCELRRLHYVLRYPRVLANVLYFFDFIWFRIFPKVIVLKKIFFLFTRGRNRVLAMAEGFGRLSYCGFEISGLECLDSTVYFTARKTAPPIRDSHPSYGPIFKMQRTGKGGEPIFIYKLRTMHPYSEYLQGFVTALSGYGDKGKVKNDFRVTAWGRFLRRFWLDEAPQIVNLLKGDLSLVGVRPLSERFLENYPEWLKEERKKRRPGCFPPYVAYRKQKVEEYIDAEIMYLKEKEKHPVLTDVRVLFVGIFNIVFNRIRSE